MVLLENDWIYSVRAVFYFFPAAKKILFSIQPVFSYDFCPGLVSRVYCNISCVLWCQWQEAVPDFRYATGVLQEPS